MNECYSALVQLSAAIAHNRDEKVPESKTLQEVLAMDIVKDQDDVDMLIAMTHAIYRSRLNPEQTAERVKAHCTVEA